MAAESSTNNGTGKKNYYSVSYGKLTSKTNKIPDGYTEFVEADLKAKIQNVESIDFRNKYVDKGKGDYPYQMFYDSLTGVISAQEKVENDHGTFLSITVEDKDGDTSVVQMNFYSKYAENLLNRLLNVEQGKELTLTPYAMPSTFELDGKNKSFYNQGVSVKVDGQKVEPKYTKEDKELPPTEVVKVQGKAQTSRDNRVDFLYEKFSSVFKGGSAPEAKEQKDFAGRPLKEDKFEPSKSFREDEHDDLPF